MICIAENYPLPGNGFALVPKNMFFHIYLTIKNNDYSPIQQLHDYNVVENSGAKFLYCTLHRPFCFLQRNY